MAAKTRCTMATYAAVMDASKMNDPTTYFEPPRPGMKRGARRLWPSSDPPTAFLVRHAIVVKMTISWIDDGDSVTPTTPVPTATPPAARVGGSFKGGT